jgi:beta-phosphoglucomutase
MPSEGLKVKSGRELCVTIAAAQWNWHRFLTPVFTAADAYSGTSAVLFDLDGVLVETADLHYLSWQLLADELGLPFNREMNQGFRGVGRMECLDKLLGRHRLEFAMQEKQMLADRKNAHYLELIATLTPADLAPGARELFAQLKAAGIRTAVVSASKNARRVLYLLGIADCFDTVVDGTDVTRSKPDPQAFNLAAHRLGVDSRNCVVIEDADAGVRAANAAGMKAIGIGPQGSPLVYGAAKLVDAVGMVTVGMILELLEPAQQNHVVMFEDTPVRLSA